ncbi:MAG: SDR family NAD(P)-dependent oxidoreductase [Propionibacteriaceae bacterium]|nr:SDR family NAD(P)-dependent oxidoreductase [Propionibacteriaceae bacterium]
MSTSQDMENLPPQVSQVLLPWGLDDSALSPDVRRVWQVYSLDDALLAIEAGATDLAVKGDESGGRGGVESTFILFQRVIPYAAAMGVRLFVHGGVGVHTAAAYLGLGAAGVVLDSQIGLMPEVSAPTGFKRLLGKLTSPDTVKLDGFRVLKWPTMPQLDAGRSVEDLVGGFDLDRHLLVAGQELLLAGDYLAKYGHVSALVAAIREARYGHLRQARHEVALRAGSGLTVDLGVEYPIIQGPMARVSDTAEFLGEVAEAGGLPMLAVGVSSAEQTARLLTEAIDVVKDRPWGVGLLGFVQPAAFEAQANQVLALKVKPTAVVIAGGRPAQGAKFEKAGIRAFLHVPSAALLDDYLAAGARRFIFEGRESGGHIGPLCSTVLWEKQLTHVLEIDSPQDVSVIFAGGVHDPLSSAFVSIMSARLSAAGARVGVIMGTAYLLTKQAVSSGAITEQFQQLALAADRTVVLESAPGQQTRALNTKFVDFFTEEKARVDKLDLDPVQRRIRLEDLNLGRARIATKGQDRDPETHRIVKLSAEDQVDRGLYMAGSVAALISEAQSMTALHQSVTGGAADLIAELPAAPLPSALTGATGGETTVEYLGGPEPIAVIGMAGIFPDAANLDEYWANILAGRDSITAVPKERWDADLFYRADSTDTDFVVSKWGGFLQAAKFDPIEFGIAPMTVSSVEPAQLLSLLVAKRALQDAGYADRIKQGLPETSVIIGTESMGELSSAYGSRTGLRSMFGDLPSAVNEFLPRVDEDSFAGILSNVTAGRIANRLNCGGRNFTVDAACASSLAALDVACQELWSQDSDMVICGGADLHNGILDFVMFSATHALSKRGYCATFDASGDGLALGEGVGMVVLKRLSDAERDHDKIYAVIRAVQGSSDGRNLGLTAPNMSGQMKALQRTYRMAGVLPSEVGLVEAHGTGTAVGDATELKALTRVMLDAGALPGQSWVGSVKTQIGHTKCAAGVAGLMRAVLAVKHGVIPPTLHLHKPVASYDDQRSPFTFNANGRASVWPDARRVAAVSGFGFGGTNFHAIVENYTDPTVETVDEEPDHGSVASMWSRELFMVRGDNEQEAHEQLRQVLALGQISHDIDLKDIAYTLATASDKPVQVCIVSGSWSKLTTKIEAVLEGRAAPGVFRRDPVAGRVALMFSGQGSQRVGMARDLFVMFPWLRAELTRHPDLERMLFPGTAFTDADAAAQRRAVTDTTNAQPLLGIVDLAIADLLTWFGVHADAVAGHSYGELPALAYADALDRDELVGLSRSRAEAILAGVGQEPGAMAVIIGPREDTDALLKGRPDVWAVNYNSATQVGVGGTQAAIDALVAHCAAQGIDAKRIEVACAFHTPLLAGAEPLFAAALDQVEVGPARVDVWSNTTAQVYPNTGRAIKDRLAEHVVKPVLFSDEVTAMHDAGVRVFVEAGPGSVLTGLVRATLDSSAVAIAADHSGADGMRSLLRCLGAYVATGRDIDVERLFAGRGAVELDLSDPQRYAGSATTWMVDGQEAVPIARWREQGERHINPRSFYSPEEIKRIMLGEDTMAPQSETVVPTPPATDASAQPLSGREQLVYTYLLNMRAMLDDQRDIMLTGMGYQPGATAMPMNAATYPGVAAVAPMPVTTMVPAVAPPPPLPPVAVMPAPVGVAVAEPLVSEPVVVAEPVGQPLEATVVPVASSRGGSASVLPRLQDLDPGQLKDIILEVVAEKTGYPPEMLGMDMDLEADLSIDSIKRLEILGALSNKIEMPEADAEEDDASSGLEQLAAIKTLRGVVDWLVELAQSLNRADVGVGAGSADLAQADAASVTAADAEPSAEEATAKTVTGESVAGDDAFPKGREGVSAGTHREASVDTPITRLVWQRQDYPVSVDSLSLDGLNFVVTDGPLAEEVCQELAEAGAAARVIALGEPVGDGVDGLVFLHTQPQVWTIRDLVELLKSTDVAKLAHVAVFDDTPGRLSSSDEWPDVAQIEGFPGLVKTLQHEYPEVRFKTVTGLTPFSATGFAATVVAELRDSDRFPEVSYADGARLRHVPQAQSARGVLDGLSGLDADSVIVVLGGAQGISPTLIARLASRIPCHYVLVGRSVRDEELAAAYADYATSEAVQRQLIQGEEMKDPKQIKAKVASIMKAKAIEEALRSVAQAGGDVTYASVDARHSEELQALLDQTRSMHGHIDGIIHAAGVLEDKLFRDKTWQSFERVYSTKVAPVSVIAANAPGLKLIVFFSSMAASFGNRGQCDYAAGNSMLDQVAQVLSTRVPAATVVSVAWGPWAGAGMVSQTLAEQMRKRGLDLLPLAGGGDFFVRELDQGHEPNVMALAGEQGQIQSFITTSLAM